MVLSSEKDNKMEMNKLLIIGGRKGYKALQKRDLISKPFFFFSNYLFLGLFKQQIQPGGFPDN